MEQKEKRIIKRHKESVSKYCEMNGLEPIEGENYYIRELLYFEWLNYPMYHHDKELREFFHSKYLSDYFKNQIKELLAWEETSEEINKFLNNPQLFNNMSEHEIKEIASAIHAYYSKLKQEVENQSLTFTNRFCNFLETFLREQLTDEELKEETIKEVSFHRLYGDRYEERLRKIASFLENAYETYEKKKENSPETQKSFLDSRHFKIIVEEWIGNRELVQKVFHDIDCGKKYQNQPLDEELRKIIAEINSYYEWVDKKRNNIANYLNPYLYQLDGKGACSYIKHTISIEELAKYILNTSGLNSRSDFYCGRTVDNSYLNSNHLIAIFEKLQKLDSKYAMEFVDLVIQLRLLDPQGFVEAFLAFAKNGFKTEELELEDSDINVQKEQIYLSKLIKDKFVSEIRKRIKELDEKWNQSLDNSQDYDNYGFSRYFSKR